MEGVGGMSAEEQRKEAVAEAVAGEEILYKIKVVEFLGRATPIILQNDNGPCPLLAICNVLLLRNQLSLSLDVSEVSLQKLLSLVAERLIDSNSNVKDKDDGYLNNQQQNISDAIDLLPRLATGIDVNVHFRKINDFEFTRECAIFDLLDIGLYHGWIVDPQDDIQAGVLVLHDCLLDVITYISVLSQDTDSAAAIGSKSYNTLVADLVQAEAKKSGGSISKEEEDYVDFAAATTATLGVPSPSLSRGRSFDDGVSVSVAENRRKGDIQEEEELMRALNISRAEVSTTVDASMSPIVDKSDSSLSLDENENESENVQKSASKISVDALGTPTINASNNQSDAPVSQTCDASSDCKGDVLAEDSSLLHSTVSGSCKSLIPQDGSTICKNFSKLEENISTAIGSIQCPNFHSDYEGDGSHIQDLITVSENVQTIMKTCSDDPTNLENLTTCLIQTLPNSLQLNGEVLQVTEPIYEGEECILRSEFPLCESAEPVYEGEMVLAEQADKTENGHPENNMDKDASEHWSLVRNFLEHNASQLTIYGLFCLQEGLKERELSVFFRNNHFSTMFKFNGDLFLLATDQGYMNQPDLVWEKLNEVNGDTVFMTGNFTQFKTDGQVHDSWNEQRAMNSTADYLAALETSGQPSLAWNSDLQLAIALQQQEFEQQPQRQQPQRQQQQPSQQPSIPGHSRLITGPQVSRTSGVSQKSESKSKEKCIIM